MTQSWTEEQIAALIDGSIEDDAEAEALRRVLQTDPDAQAVAERIERSNNLLRSAFPVPDENETPAAIRAAILSEPGKVATLPRRRRWAQIVPAAAAACVALMIGVAVGPYLPSGGETSVASLQPDPLGVSLQSLENLPSGETAPDGLVPTLTFVDGAGRACREFERFDAQAELQQTGVACRGDGGTWQAVMVVLAPVTEAAPDGYVPASGDAGAVLAPALEALQAGEPLSPEREAALIGNGWRQSE